MAEKSEIEAEEEEVRKEARRLAKAQGLDWNGLPHEKRREFKVQVRRTRRQAKSSLGKPVSRQSTKEQ
jgi:hypothetical protein